jgi:EAL domain-containing protein (putative c-di-GMP-specific phosphodiesterase class I)
VENANALPILRELGCDMVQGYWVSRPMPPNEFRRWLAASQWSAKAEPTEPGKRSDRLRAV